MKAKTKFPLGIVIAMICYAIGVQTALTNTVGMFFVPVSEALGVARGTISLYYSLQAIVTMVALFFAGKILQKYQKKIKLLLLFASALLFIGYALYAIGDALWYWYLGGALVGIGVAFTTQMFIGTIINNWFKAKASTIMGVIMAFTNIIGLFVAPFVTGLIASHGYKTAYWVLNVAMLVFTVLPNLFLIHFKPEHAGREPYDEVVPANTAEEVEIPVQMEKSVSYKTALKSPAFWLFVINMFALAAWCNFVQIIPGFAASAGMAGAMIGTVTSAFSVGSIIGKFVLGWLTDKIGPNKGNNIFTALGIIGLLLMIMDRNAGFMIFAGAFLFGFSNSIMSIVPPMIVREGFGMKNYAAIYGNITIALWVATAVIIPFYNFLYDATGSYNTPMFVTMGILVAGTICMMVGRKLAVKLPREE